MKHAKGIGLVEDDELAVKYPGDEALDGLKALLKYVASKNERAIFHYTIIIGFKEVRRRQGIFRNCGLGFGSSWMLELDAC